MGNNTRCSLSLVSISAWLCLPVVRIDAFSPSCFHSRREKPSALLTASCIWWEGLRSVRRLFQFSDSQAENWSGDSWLLILVCVLPPVAVWQRILGRACYLWGSLPCDEVCIYLGSPLLVLSLPPSLLPPFLLMNNRNANRWDFTHQKANFSAWQINLPPSVFT